MNPIPDMEKPSGQSEAYDLTYFDGHKMTSSTSPTR